MNPDDMMRCGCGGDLHADGDTEVWVSQKTKCTDCGGEIHIARPFVLTDRDACPCCHRSFKAVPYSLTKKAVVMLDAMAKLHEAGHEWIRVEHGRNLIVKKDMWEVASPRSGGSTMVSREECVQTVYRAQDSASIMMYIGLIEVMFIGSALYRITPIGWQFGSGLLAVPKTAYCLKGHVLALSDDLVTRSEVSKIPSPTSYEEYKQAALSGGAVLRLVPTAAEAERDPKRRRYLEYMSSPEWAARSADRKKLAGYRCEFEHEGGRCTATTSLECHHLTYDRLGAELDEDLQVLCEWHHSIVEMWKCECLLCDDSVFGSDVALAAAHLKKFGNARMAAKDNAPKFCPVCVKYGRTAI